MTNLKYLMKKASALLLAATMCLGMMTAPAAATSPEEEEISVGSFVNISGDGGADAISLCADRTFKAAIPVDMTEEDALAALESLEWNLDYLEEMEYVDLDLYPNHTEGGMLDTWKCQNNQPMFTNIESGVEVVDGKVYLTVTFDSNEYFYSRNVADPSAPHSNGGAYLDVCGYYDLEAVCEDAVLAAVKIKIAPYDNFHTMDEIYEEIDEMVEYAAENTDLYVEKFSMGMSAGDNGLEALDMPYLIIAKDQEAVANWLEIKAYAESDPTGLLADIESGALGDYQVPVLYSNVHANEVAASDGIIKFTWMLLEAAANSGEIDYDTLTGFTAEGEAELAAQLGEPGAADSVAIPDLVADDATFLGYIKGKDANGKTLSKSGVVDLETYYEIETITVDLDALLDDIFFIIVPEENVEGRTYVTRTSSGGFDLNRDNSFQTQEETQNMTKMIAFWNPVSFTEFHGRVQTFQCEPCDPPHEPNFEYDLLAEHLMTGGEALGIAAIANNDGFNSYVIPQRDYLSYTGETNEDGSYQTCWYDPWDDMSTSYTPQYAMLHGTVSYTVELPAYNDDTSTAVAYGILGQADYVANEKEGYLVAQTKILERGVTNFNSDAYELVGQWFCDQYDIEGAEADIFRPEYDGEGQNGNFYPECYIIPVDAENQVNLDAADQMLEYLDRNGVQMMFANEAFVYDGVEYPAGTAVVSMYQAKRSVANGVLYDGTVITEWPVLYSEGITAFNYTRGFDMIVCAEPAAYETIAAACSVSDSWEITSALIGTAVNKVIITNASEASTAAINDLLQSNKQVEMIIEGEYKGSFLVSYADYLSVADEYLITAVALENGIPATKTISKAPVIYINGKPADNTSGFVKSTLVSSVANYNYDRQAMEMLGFETTDNPADADLIIGATKLDNAALAAVKAGISYIGYGSSVASTIAKLFPSGQMARTTVGGSSMDALAYVTYPSTESMITASYIAEGDNILYGYGAGYFSSIPVGAEILVQIDGSKEALEGFLCSTGAHFDDFFNDSIQAFAYQGESVDGDYIDIVVFANTLTNKMHQRDEFNYISNAAFNAVLTDSDSGSSSGSSSSSSGSSAKPVAPAEPETEAWVNPFTDVSENAYYYKAAAWAVQNGVTTGMTESTFEPGAACNRAQAITFLWRASGSPEPKTTENPFADVSKDAYYYKAILWAVENGITSGVTANAFQPTGTVTRGQAMTFLWRMTGEQKVSAENSFADVAANTYYHDAVLWAAQNGITSGKSATAFGPADSCVRSHMVTFLYNHFVQ